MAATRRTVDIEDLDNVIKTRKFKARGHVYVISELPMDEYQKTIKKATSQVKDPITGEDTDKFDPDYHTAIMLGRCVTIDGKKVTAEQIYEKGTGLVRQLQREVSAMHFDEEPLEEIEDDDGVEPGEAEASS